MARKKKYKDGEMEAEFNKFMYQHMYVTIRSTLINNKDIIDSDLVHYTLGVFEGTDEEKLEALCCELVNLHESGRDREALPLYEYCWKILSPKLADNYQYPY